MLGVLEHAQWYDFFLNNMFGKAYNTYSVGQASMNLKICILWKQDFRQKYSWNHLMENLLFFFESPSKTKETKDVYKTKKSTEELE